MISLYSYYCLSNSMVTYESSRMNYINEKECELNAREQDIKSVNVCQNQNLSYEKAINHILSLAQKGHKDNIVCNTKQEINSMVEKETDINVEKNKDLQAEKQLAEQEKDSKNSNDSDDWDDDDDNNNKKKNKKNAIESELGSEIETELTQEQKEMTIKKRCKKKGKKYKSRIKK